MYRYIYYNILIDCCCFIYNVHCLLWQSVKHVLLNTKYTAFVSNKNERKFNSALSSTYILREPNEIQSYRKTKLEIFIETRNLVDLSLIYLELLFVPFQYYCSIQHFSSY